MPSEAGFQQEQTIQLMRERERSVQLHLFLLSHAARCKDPTCPSPNCSRMKALLRHEENCTIRANGGCASCRRIWALFHIHSRQCRKQQDCHVPHCREISTQYRHLAATTVKNEALQESIQTEVVKI